MKTIIVTGGLGFIGSNLIDLLLKKNFYVVNLDKISYSSNFYNTKKISKNKNYKFIKCDISNKKVKNILFKYKPVCIFNLAAETHVDRSIDNPQNFIKSNIVGVYNLLESFKKFSPGKLLLSLLIRWSISKRIKIFDFGFERLQGRSYTDIFVFLFYIYVTRCIWNSVINFIHNRSIACLGSRKIPVLLIELTITINIKVKIKPQTKVPNGYLRTESDLIIDLVIDCYRSETCRNTNIVRIKLRKSKA